ncbi:hypothetical protein COCNU_03G006470 [Cocos nucifera]|uniref:Uncharacterized protein n=1 Tax=Cocos nucifera TaxID=13894 RepID=A0A8K0MYG3_COCNU|nr:hypothetical protein COCNU_03G006470 [Cocos nucifera]
MTNPTPEPSKPQPRGERKASNTISVTMMSIGATYARLHVQQEHYKEKLKRKEGEEAKGEKKGSEGKVHPSGPATSSSNP